MLRKSSLAISGIEASRIDDRSRIEVQLDGHPLWFETTDSTLVPSIEGIATAMFLPSLFQGRRLNFGAPVCKTWYEGINAANDICHEWWRYPKLPPTVDGFRSPLEAKSAGTGLFFTGGVDSFYSLLQFPRPIDHLIYAVDYDVPPQAPDRLSGFEPHLRQLADEIGIKVIVVRSNLRLHPLFKGPSWRQSHGAALIGVAHFLSGVIGEVVISSSNSMFHPRPWGSHWDLDHLWSSDALKVTHFGQDHRKAGKLARIADAATLQKYVRPCWENMPNQVNCSVCEKCVRTQIAISACGDLERFTSFDHTIPLVEKIAGLRRIGSPELIPTYANFLQLSNLGFCHSEIEELIRRSRMSMFRKTLRHRVRTWMSFGQPCPTT